MSIYYATDFLFDTQRLSTFHMMICSYNTSGGMETLDTPPVVFNTVKPIGRDKFYLYGSRYESALTATFQIMKCSGSDISPMELSKINRWLCRKDQYRKFKIIQKGYEDICHNAIITSKEIRLNGILKGLELTVTTDSPYALLEPVTHNFTLNAPGKHVIYDRSDEVGEIPLILKASCLSGGELKIYNKLTGITTVVKRCSSGETITLDGENEIISSTLSSHNISDDFNWEFMTVGNNLEERENILEISLPCKLEITYTPNKKLGI